MVSEEQKTCGIPKLDMMLGLDHGTEVVWLAFGRLIESKCFWNMCRPLKRVDSVEKDAMDGRSRTRGCCFPKKDPSHLRWSCGHKEAHMYICIYIYIYIWKRSQKNGAYVCWVQCRAEPRFNQQDAEERVLHLSLKTFHLRFPVLRFSSASRAQRRRSLPEVPGLSTFLGGKLCGKQQAWTLFGLPFAAPKRRTRLEEQIGKYTTLMYRSAAQLGRR